MSHNTITLQYSGVRGQQKNTSYPFRKEISTPEELAEIAEFDHMNWSVTITWLSEMMSRRKISQSGYGDNGIYVI